LIFHCTEGINSFPIPQSKSLLETQQTFLKQMMKSTRLGSWQWIPVKNTLVTWLEKEHLPNWHFTHKHQLHPFPCISATPTT